MSHDQYANVETVEVKHDMLKAVNYASKIVEADYGQYSPVILLKLLDKVFSKPLSISIKNCAVRYAVFCYRPHCHYLYLTANMIINSSHSFAC